MMCDFVGSYLSSGRRFPANVILLGVLAVTGAPAAHAANITVTSNGDAVAADGDCTLREAINSANNDAADNADCADGSGADIIDFDADYIITLGSQLPAVTTEITINGNGAANTIVQANALPDVATYRVFEVSGTGDLTLDSLTVRNGRCNGACLSNVDSGGGIRNVGGSLTLIDCTVSGNTASGQSGGIDNANGGTLTVTNSTISGNTAARGGGFVGNGTMTVTGSTISGNEAEFTGGGIRNEGALTLNYCTISGNISGSDSGGIYSQGPTLSVTNCTVSENSGSGIQTNGGIVTVINSTFSGNTGRLGGGILNAGGAQMTVTNSTISGNTATQSTGGIYNTGDCCTRLTLNNTLVALNGDGDCINTGGSGGPPPVMTAGADNIDSDGSCDGATTKTAAEINLGPLAPNGGPTETMALLSGSAAINAGNNALALDKDGNPLTTDQRGVGFARIIPVTVDVGAFEAPCDDESAQACCIPSDLPGPPTCEVLTPQCCVDRGGTPGGDGSECTEPRPCCDDLTNGFVCRMADPLCCALLTGGTPGELGTTCEPEACCSSSDYCFFTPPSCCARLDRTALGPGTQCGSSVAGSDPGFQACCRTDGSCDMADVACCTADGGTPGAENSYCSAPQACCQPDGQCGLLDPICCSAMGGTPQGTGSTCDAPIACCLADGSCTDNSPTCCDELGGTYLDAIGLLPTCSEPRACCMADGSCAELAEACCLLGGGSPQDAGTSCTTPESCCFDNGTCQDLDPLCCTDAGGSPGGSATSCAVPQNCCFAEEDACVQRDPACCALQGGVIDHEAPVVVGECPPSELTIECDQPVPPFAPQFTDNCDNNLEPTGITLTAPGDCPQERTIDRDAGARDNCGNSAQCAQVVHVVDTTAPVVTCRALIVATCPGPNGIRPQDVPGLNDVSAVDNCDEEVPVGVTLPQVFSPTCDEAPHVVTWSATDDCGNTGTCETRIRVIGGMCCPTVTDTDLKLMVTDLDLRQDTNGPVTTKARFDIWNSNEVRFSGTEKCITCWNETLISEYVAVSNHFLVENLQTDKGKARIQNEGSDVCPDSSDSPLLGVAIKEHTFLGSPHVEMRSAITLPGEGEQAATILYDIITEPEEANITGRAGGLTISQVPSYGTRPTGPQIDDGTTVLGDGVVADNRASTMFKGSLVAFPVIEVKWDRHGQLIQDTFIQILNDNPGEVKVQFYQVNGDAPLDAVIDPNTNEIIERAHPGWNWSDYQITLTGDESCYFSVATGQPKGVSPIAVLDPGNPNGRPDLDPSNPGGRLIRGFLVAWAVNDDQHEIRWNHLKGHTTIVRYDHGTAFDYNPWNFRVVSGVPEGAESDGTAGQLKLDGIEYDLAPETLIFDFYAAGATALTNPAVEWVED